LGRYLRMVYSRNVGFTELHPIKDATRQDPGCGEEVNAFSLGRFHKLETSPKF